MGREGRGRREGGWREGEGEGKERGGGGGEGERGRGGEGESEEGRKGEEWCDYSWHDFTTTPTILTMCLWSQHTNSTHVLGKTKYQQFSLITSTHV